MNLLSFNSLFICLCLLLSCSRNDIEPSLLIGTWDSVELQFDDIDGTPITTRIDPYTILKLAENQFYYKNYVSGSWSLTDNQLQLTPNENLRMDSDIYEVISLTDSILKIQIKVEEGHYYNAIDSDQAFLLTEVYKRE